MTRFRSRFVLGLLPFLLGACVSTRPSDPPDWLAWRSKRAISVGGTNGWTTVVGLHWLAEGTNVAGSAPNATVPLPAGRAPARVGEFLRNGDVVRFIPTDGVLVTVSNQPIREIEIASDKDGSAPPTRLQVGDLSLTLLQRGDRLGIRVRDSQSPARRQFRGLPCFAYDPHWRLEARYVPFPEVRSLKVPDVTGRIQSLPSPGQLVFQANGGEHRLDVVEEPGEEDFFILFRDETAGSGTYASGRFLYAPRPDASGRVVLDFNRSYTPPCGFTAFATCPLPPPQNRLPFPIRAGERRPRGPHPAH